MPLKWYGGGGGVGSAIFWIFSNFEVQLIHPYPFFRIFPKIRSWYFLLKSPKIKFFQFFKRDTEDHIQSLYYVCMTLEHTSPTSGSSEYYMSHWNKSTVNIIFGGGTLNVDQLFTFCRLRNTTKVWAYSWLFHTFPALLEVPLKMCVEGGGWGWRHILIFF